MIVVRGALAGTHPFSESLIQSILDFKYGRDKKETVQEKFQKGLTELILLQENLGFPNLSVGSFGIEDLIRPFTRSLSSLKSYQDLGDLPINRWHYTNTFYRQPELVEKFPENAEVVNSDVHSLSDDNSYSHNYVEGKTAKIILPGPYSFVKLVQATNNNVYPSEGETIIAAGEYLAEEVDSLSPNYLEIQFDEPYFVWERVSRNNREYIKSAYEAIQSKIGNRRSIINTFFEDASNLISFLLDLPTSGFGIDFQKSNILNLSEYSFENKILQAGIIDAQNFAPKSDGSLDQSQNKFYSKVLSSLLELNPSELIVSSTTSLDYLPREIADEKLEQVGELVNSLQELK
ncbi:MAG: hypothetical protein ACW99A_00985 [Candidatus Kariarchaeaceae archaeon]